VRKNIFYYLLAVVMPISAMSQDTVRLMTYNLLNYPYVAASRADTLAIIIDDVLPDVLIVNELQNNSGATTILNNAMNTNGRSNYSRAIFYNGPASDNMCYYDNTKFGLASQRQITTTLRDISEYVLYWKGNLPGSDTIFFNVYAAHLKAGSSGSDETQRLSEAQVIKDRLDQRMGIENIFLGGDFNIYTNLEPAFTEIKSGGATDLFDPINNEGAWHANPVYANIHTQATGSINGGSGGGLDDRFDFFFVSEDVLSGLNSVQYITGSYKAYGQDGNRYNSDLNVWPPNTAVSPEVASALYNMSDHLPVIMDVLIDPSLNINSNTANNWKFFCSQETGELVLRKPVTDSKIVVKISDLAGKLVDEFVCPNTIESRININNLTPGIYLATAAAENHRLSIKFVGGQ